MAKIDITDKLIGSLSETYFKEYCHQHGWAYISLEQINENKIEGDVLIFRKGFNRIPVLIPQEIINEVQQISKPSNKSNLQPSFVYDFLICKMDHPINESESLQIKRHEDFRWAEVKTGMMQLSDNQIRTLEKIIIPLYRYRLPFPLSDSKDVNIYDDLVDEEFIAEHRVLRELDTDDVYKGYSDGSLSIDTGGHEVDKSEKYKDYAYFDGDFSHSISRKKRKG